MKNKIQGLFFNLTCLIFSFAVFGLEVVPSSTHRERPRSEQRASSPELQEAKETRAKYAIPVDEHSGWLLLAAALIGIAVLFHHRRRA